MSETLTIVAGQQIVQAAETFDRLGQVRLVNGRSINPGTVKDADVLLVRSVTRVDETLLKGSAVRFVGSATSGIDHIDQTYLENAGICFAHAPGSNARSVAEYVLSSLFAIAELQDFSLTDKTVGIIGCGEVGSRLRHFLQCLNIKCLIHDPPRQLHQPDDDYVDLETIATADIISLHVPLDSEPDYPTRNLVDANFLSKLKNDVILINTSRGEVINEVDLTSFKQHHPEATLVLDVWHHEPDINLELLQQTLIATPHIAGYSFDGKLKATRMLYRALQAFIGKPVTDETGGNNETALTEISADQVSLAVMQSYDVRSDAVGLRQLLTLAAAERPAFFDMLRKNYPVRREFSQRIVKSSTMDQQTAQQCQQLGFKLTSA